MPVGAVPAEWPGNSTATSSGVSSTTTSTRTYCMKATRRSSAPSSWAIVTMPEAPPATMPSAPVARSTPVAQDSATPQARLISSVAAPTSSTGSHECPRADSASDCR